MVVEWVAGVLEEVMALEARRLSVKTRTREGRRGPECMRRSSLRQRPRATSSPKLLEPKPREDPRSTTVRALGEKRQALAPAGPGLGDAEPSV